MTTPTEVPPLWSRLRGLVITGWIIAAVRLGLDAWWPEGPITMHFGLFYLMPLALAYVGLTHRWGPIRWMSMALTMLLLAVLVWSISTAIAYTTGQFMEWSHGRFWPGTGVTGADGEVVDRRAMAIQPTVLGKIGAGLLHGALSGVAGTVWCMAIGTVVIWLPARLRRS